MIRRALALSLLLTGLCATTAKASLGIGVNLGDPTALDIRVGQQKTLEGMAGWSLRTDGRSSFVLVGNMLFHGSSLGRESPISGIFPYAGIGLGFWHNGDQGAWLQVPLDIDFRFSVPVEVGFHIDPGMDVVPNTDVTVHWGLGVRYWFK
jgi:hypothetical protein